MDRRLFLQGVFGGVASAGLIVAANQSEIEAFASPLKVGEPLVLDKPIPAERTETVTAGEHLYNAKGEVVAIVSSYGLGRGGIVIEAVGVGRFSMQAGFGATTISRTR